MKNCEACQHASYCDKRNTGKPCKIVPKQKSAAIPAADPSPASQSAAYVVNKFKLSYVREPDNSETTERRTIARSNDAAEFCRKYLADMPIERFCVLALDSTNTVIGFTEIDGTPNQCLVYTSNVFRFLLSVGASAFVIAHNHPAGTLRPSKADWQITERLFKAGKLLEVPLHDHVFVGNGTITLREDMRWSRL